MEEQIDYEVLNLDRDTLDNFLSTLHKSLKDTENKILYGKIPKSLIENSELSSILNMIFEPVTISEKDGLYEV